MEQPLQIKCHLCGNAADFAFAYARFSDREAFFGVIYRGVCRECLRAYIESIKHDRHLRGEMLLWPLVLLPIGALLAALSRSIFVQGIGFLVLGLAVAIPVFMRLWQRREAISACRASDAENEARYSERMCRADALNTSRQTKLIYLKPEYAAEDADLAWIARETGAAPEAARLLQKLAIAAQKLLRGQMLPQTQPGAFDKPDAL